MVRVAVLAVSVALLGGFSPEQSLQEKLERAQTLVRRGELEAAEREYLALVQLHPQSYAVHNDLGALYMSEKRYESACREFARAADLNPRVPAVQQNLGICFLEASDSSKAAESLSKA
jgi:Tfp pilus assembly protein PilF